MEFINEILKKHIIIEEFNGRYYYKENLNLEKNKYWLVKNKNTEEEYYIMDCGKLKLVIIDKNNINKISKSSNAWYLCLNGYVASRIDKKQIYMHAFLMNHYGHGLEKGALSVDHINQNKLDNRMCNLRITTQSIQNSNRKYSKNENSKYNLNRPDGMEDIDLPRYVEYKFEYRDNEKKTGIKEYFVLSHEKCPKYGKKNCIVSSKSNEISAIDKFEFIIEKMNELDIQIQYS